MRRCPLPLLAVGCGGRGDLPGAVAVKDAAGVVELQVRVARISVAANEFLSQSLTVRFAHPDPLAGDGRAQTWAAKGGPVEVTSVSANGIGIQPRNVGFETSYPDFPYPISISGNAGQRIAAFVRSNVR